MVGKAKAPAPPASGRITRAGARAWLKGETSSARAESPAQEAGEVQTLKATEPKTGNDAQVSVKEEIKKEVAEEAEGVSASVEVQTEQEDTKDVKPVLDIEAEIERRIAERMALQKQKEEDEKAATKKREREELEQLEQNKKKISNELKDAEKQHQTRKQAVRDHEKTWNEENNKRESKIQSVTWYVNHYRKKLEESENNLAELADERKAGDASLGLTKAECASAARLQQEKAVALKDATRAIELHPITQANKFSRACTICVNANPVARAVLVACGHNMCVNCAQELRTPNASTICCPFCRANTTYVRLFEAVESSEDDQAGPSAAKKAKA